MKHLLFLDFESYYDSKSKYDLRHTSIVQYVRDPQFKLFGAGFAFRNDPVHWTSVRHFDDPLIQSLTTAETFKGLGRDIGWENIAVVGHNLKFDGFILREKFGITPGQWIDTLGMSKAVLGKTVRSHSLASLAEHFGLPSKGIMRTDGLKDLTQAQEDELAEYCIHDVELCRDIYHRLAADFPENQYEALHLTVNMFVNARLHLNVPLLQQTSIQEAARRANIFTEIGIPKSEFASNVKFPALLVSKGYDVPTKPSPRRRDEKGDPVQIPALALGDPEFLELLESENEELRTLCEARVAAKSTLLETRSAKLAAIGSTGAWPFDVVFSGADQTHRFSGGDGAGGNPQNFTRGSALRDAVEAPDGYELVVGDFSNVELRLVAYLSKDPGLVQAIEQGIDLYCDFASVFYGQRVTKADEQKRRFGKTAILGLGYGMGWRKFIKTVRVQTGQTITEKDSRKAVELYRLRYAKVPALWAMLDNMIPVLADPAARTTCDLPVKFAHQTIILPSGLKLRYPNLREEPGERGPEWTYDVWFKGNLEPRKLYGGKVLENVSQALAGELCKEAMVMMGNNMVGQVHDELHVLCRKGLGFITQQTLKRAMSTAPSWLPPLTLDAEIGAGRNWGECK